ncbi:unnamed protein product [Rotaria magnacalcarata]|uniref:Uncharacterized protein n=1 Tax=Rotaria magnacalcarata TaxID=392030 RepID=A0A816CIB4_9BILA|nr:unnamed protein product [Rotaria magnacalcarata]CAF2094346.1 unnamed protein product [Rotaria magnacalcarata]CAF2100635.1 unnamed protein product [Rotaria magnacalcarata]
MAIDETEQTDEIDIVGNLSTKEEIITFINELNELFTIKELKIFDTQVEQYGPYTVVHGYFTTILQAKVCRNIWRSNTDLPFTVPYYCAKYYRQIRTIYCRKYTVLTSFTVDKQTVNESVLINLGSSTKFIFRLKFENKEHAKIVKLMNSSSSVVLA